jgi:hypothetical protein
MGKAQWSAEVWNFADGQLPTLKMTAEAVEEEPVVWFEGAGTEQSPYLINKAQDLANLSKLVYEDETRVEYRDKHYRLTANISISAYNDDGGWIPIGVNRSHSFRGVFDGDNHTVRGLSVCLSVYLSIAKPWTRAEISRDSSDTFIREP